MNFFVLPFRPQKSAKLYARIWDGESFPLITNTRDFTKNVSEEIKKIDPNGYVEVNHAFLLSPPYVNEVYDSWEEDVKKGIGATKLIVIPMFPQYSESTIASGIDALAKELSKRVKIPTFEVITNFHRTHAFIDNSVEQVDSKLSELTKQGKKIDSLIPAEKKIEWFGAPIPIDSSNVLSRMLWVSKNHPEIWEKTCYVLLPKDFCIFHLTGRLVTDPISNIGIVGKNNRYINR